MTLEDKRKKLFEELYREGHDKKTLFVIFSLIDNQDKEALKELESRLLKKYKFASMPIMKIIKEIFGGLVE